MTFNSRIPIPMKFPIDLTGKLFTCELCKSEIETATFRIDIIISEPDLPFECYIKDLVLNSDGKITLQDHGSDSDILVLTYTHKDLIETARKCKQVEYND